jgi:cold-inducible RNA-binding protein
MGNRLFVGNLSYNTNEDELKATFGKFGHVVQAKIIVDRETGSSRGFGFVEYNTDAEASGAIEELNGSLMAGRALAVKVAEQRPPRAGGYGSGGGGYAGSAPRNNFQAPDPLPLPQDNGGGRGRGGKDRKRRRNDDAW